MPEIACIACIRSMFTAAWSVYYSGGKTYSAMDTSLS